jgi:hypothetical protein
VLRGVRRRRAARGARDVGAGERVCGGQRLPWAVGGAPAPGTAAPTRALLRAALRHGVRRRPARAGAARCRAAPDKAIANTEEFRGRDAALPQASRPSVGRCSQPTSPSASPPLTLLAPRCPSLQQSRSFNTTPSYHSPYSSPYGTPQVISAPAALLFAKVPPAPPRRLAETTCVFRCGRGQTRHVSPSRMKTRVAFRPNEDTRRLPPE